MLQAVLTTLLSHLFLSQQRFYYVVPVSFSHVIASLTLLATSF